ncbi:sulfatase-like hydrolase/transferase [Streptomyces sp. 11-1-2]|uniref:sulfatase-like hydrolase/transferase n=1 Tax=unclassified Streptomyces TaxID=2593676 RepID=UPI001969470D|nr:sulfatase-like hydrolase/transferase [Streptomyces sp. 11-1-2]
MVIVLDDVGFSDLGCFGSDIETPAMDALASGGLRYTNFHTTTLCSPTRASLLTGRNHHSVGMRMLSNFDTGFPSGRGRVTKAAAMLPEVLRDNGFNTMAVGKWHLAPMEQTTASGPYTQWPLSRGFERYYGFLETETDSFYPELFYDNHAVAPPKTPEEGYHLSEDLVDRAIEFVTDQTSVTPEKPFFMYMAFGAAHAPHQAPREYLEKYRGRFDHGWDAERATRHARQIERGILARARKLPLGLGAGGQHTVQALQAEHPRGWPVMTPAHRITAYVDRAATSDEGVLVSLGNISSGYVLYGKDNRQVYEYNFLGTRYTVTSAEELPVGPAELTFAFDKTGDMRGVGHLYVSGRSVGSADIPRVLPHFLGWQGLDIGRDTLSPSSPSYDGEFAFTGKFEKVVFTVAPDEAGTTPFERID